MEAEDYIKGGKGSGNFSHGGRPGQVGGSASDRPPLYVESKPKDDSYNEQVYGWLGGVGRSVDDEISWLKREGRVEEANALQESMRDVSSEFREAWFHGGSYTEGEWKTGTWFAKNEEGAGINYEMGRSSNITAVYLAVKNPMYVEYEFVGVSSETLAKARKGRHDAIVGDNHANGPSVFVINPSVILSIPKDTETTKSLKATPQLAAYVFNPYMRAYVPLIGEPVDTSGIRSIISEIRSGAANRMATLAQRVVDGTETNLAQFAVEFKTEVKRLYLSTHVLARGGVAQMTQSDWGKLGAAVREQFRYADAFVRDIENERTQMAIPQRIGLYTDSAWGARGEFENVVRDRELKLGSLERRVLGEADHCDECVELAERDWQPPSLMPDIGDTECGLGCACHFEFENTQLDELNQAFGGQIRPKHPASGHTEIGVEGEPQTEQEQFTLFPDMEKSLKGGEGSGSWDAPGQPRFAYHASHSVLTELSAREVGSSYDSIGTWLTLDSSKAEELYGPNVHSVDLGSQNLLESHTENFDKFFYSNQNLFDRLFPEEGAGTFARFTEKGLRDKHVLGLRKEYLTEFRSMLEGAGYTGIVWKNSTIDLPKSGPEKHDVLVLFNKKPLSIS